MCISVDVPYKRFAKWMSNMDLQVNPSDRSEEMHQVDFCMDIDVYRTYILD